MMIRLLAASLSLTACLIINTYVITHKISKIIDFAMYG